MAPRMRSVRASYANRIYHAGCDRTYAYVSWSQYYDFAFVCTIIRKVIELHLSDRLHQGQAARPCFLEGAVHIQNLNY